MKEKFHEGSVQTVLNNIAEAFDGTLSWRVNMRAYENCFEKLANEDIKDCFWEGPRKVIIGGKSKFTSLIKVTE